MSDDSNSKTLIVFFCIFGLPLLDFMGIQIPLFTDLYNANWDVLANNRDWVLVYLMSGILVYILQWQFKKNGKDTDNQFL